jgi:hypothetical protein
MLWLQISTDYSLEHGIDDIAEVGGERSTSDESSVDRKSDYLNPMFRCTNVGWAPP